MKSLILVFTLLLSSSAFSKRFTNGFIEFELPPKWQCVLEGSEWVCQSESADRKKEAIIILAAKQRGPQDELAEYTKYLKSSKTYSLPGAKTQVSEPKSVDTQRINGIPWVDALHLASEVPGFYTRYLATVKADIGVAVTFSVTKSLYNAYKDTFDAVIRSMRIFRQTKIDTGAIARRRGKQGENLEGVELYDPYADQAGIAGVAVEKKKGDSGGGEDLILFLIIGAVAGFVVLKKLKGGKKTG